MRFIRKVAMVAVLGAIGMAAQAAPVTASQTLGGIDSFGTVLSGFGSQGSNEAFDSGVLDPFAPGPTDLLVEGAALQFSSILPAGAGTISSARLVLRTGGFGLFGLATVKVNGVEVGTLTDGDNPDALLIYREETAHVDVFDNLLAVAGLVLTGNDLVEIITAPGPDPLYADGGAIDYAILEITYDDGSSTGGGTTPEPASLALAALGLIAAGAARRRAAR